MLKLKLKLELDYLLVWSQELVATVAETNHTADDRPVQLWYELGESNY